MINRIMVLALLLVSGLSVQAEPRTYFIHNDQQGTAQVLTDQSQQVVWRASYTPYGEATLEVQQVTFPLRLPGQYYDRETGLSYNYFRTYDSGLGRYLESDPIGLRGGMNSYTYVGGNPVRFIDSLGLDKTVWNLSGPRNGNWGGAGWSGGKSGGRPGSKPPTDSGDACYREHDFCYMGCDEDRACKSQDRDTDGDGYIDILEGQKDPTVPAYNECIHSCNRRLVQCLRDLDNDSHNWPKPPRPGTEGDSESYRRAAIIFFE
jgi:RHS repeat-associated protein